MIEYLRRGTGSRECSQVELAGEGSRQEIGLVAEELLRLNRVLL